MALDVIPLWPIVPDWSQPITETLEWLTAIHTSPTGAEQRQAMRLTPRRSMEFSVLVRGGQRAHFLGFLDAYGASDFYCPLWHERGVLSRSEALGSLAATVTGEKAETAACDALCAARDVAYGWPVAEVSSGTASGGATRLTLASPGWTGQVSRGQVVYPMARARLDASAVDWTRHTDDVLAATVRVEFQYAQTWGGSAGLTTYAGYPVVDVAPNERKPQGGRTGWRVLGLDNDTGRRAYLDTAGLAFPGLTQGSTMVGRARADLIRSVLYTLRGRAVQAWFPSPLADFTLVASVADGEDQLIVIRNGYADYGGPQDRNDRLLLRMRDGTTYFRQITGAAVVGETDTELLTLDAGFDLGFAPADVLRIGLLMPGRLDQDRFELVHLTDTDGVCEVALTVRRVPVLRSAADWTPPEFPDDEPV